MKFDPLREIISDYQALKDVTRNAAIALPRQGECGHRNFLVGLLGTH